MVKGNLLLETAAFQLTTADLPLFAKRIEAFQLAIDKCREHGDTIYGKGDLSVVNFLGLPLYEYIDPATLHLIQKHIPDFSRDMHVFLTNHLLGYDNKTHSACTTLNQLETHFPKANNGLLGPECNRFPCASALTVSDEESWHRWKIAYLSKYPQHIVWSSATHSYLPNLTYSNSLLAHECRSRFGGKDHQDFYANAGKLAGGAMVTLSRQVGKIIAEANFYQYSVRVSKLNKNARQLRDVYSIIKDGKQVYLSVDVDNAAFEVCDHTGQHQGEYPFDGGKSKQPDHSGKHNIRVS